MADADDDSLSVTLYYRRESHSGQKTWVLVSKATCLPNGAEHGAMVVAFREKAKRELSKHKAPNFPLPSAFSLGCQLQVVVQAAAGAGEEEARGGGRAGPKILGEVKFHLRWDGATPLFRCVHTSRQPPINSSANRHRMPLLQTFRSRA